MACTRTLKIAFGALLLLAGLLAFDITSQARERGFSTVAGNNGGVKNRSGNRSKNFRQNRVWQKHLRRKAGRSLHDTLFFIDRAGLINNRNSEAEIRRRSFLREKVSIMRSRSGAKIIRVSEKMKQLGEARALKREAKMLDEMENLDIRYYRVITHPLNMGPDGCADAIYGDLFATRAN